MKLPWETNDEKDNLGFFIWRATSEGGERTQLNNKEPIPSNFVPGMPYSFLDPNVVPGMTYYWLQDVSTNLDQINNANLPSASITALRWLFVPMILR